MKPWRIICGDVRTALAELPDGSAQCCVTSPPYWGLRSYIADDDPRKPLEIGLERTPEEYVAKLIEVFREVRRVLAADGTLWLNLGDCYATGAGKVGNCPGGGEQGERWAGRGVHSAEHAGKQSGRVAAMGPMTQPNRMPLPGLKPKDLVGIPWRVAFALQADGWWLRSDVIWHKPNPMPESVLDRPTKAHEYLFLFAKSETYFYDNQAISELAIRRQSGNKRRVIADGAPGTRPADHLGSGVPWSGETRNARSVWTIETKPFAGAHFAVMPEELARRCILAGCPTGGGVLDPFNGEGTAGVAAIKNDRTYVGIELNPDYVAMSERRLEAAYQETVDRKRQAVLPLGGAA